jgi:hypothetical protein
MLKEEYERARDSWLCSGCASPKPGVGSIDVRIQEEGPGDVPLTFVSGCGIGLVHQEFLIELGADNVAQDLLLGTVFGPSGNEIEGWSTFRGRHKLVIRGTSNVGLRQCSVCGRNIYFATGKRYLYPLPSPSVRIFESHLWGLVIGKNLMQSISLHAWPKLGVEKLKVLEKPIDRLPEIILE